MRIDGLHKTNNGINYWEVQTHKPHVLGNLNSSNLRYLHMSITPSSGVRKADGYRVIGHIASNSIGQSLAFDFIKEEWDTVHKA